MLDSEIPQEQWSPENGDSQNPDGSQSGSRPSPELPARYAYLATSRKRSFAHYLLSLGFPPEYVVTTTPEDFYTELNRGFREKLRQIRGEKPEEGPNPLVAKFLEQAARQPAEPDLTALLDEIETSLEPDDERFRFFTPRALESSDFDTRYLIPGILAAGQPGGIFGAFKTLKTSVTADLLISLASGTPFLGHFPVAESGPTLFFSGESELSALRSIARRICAGRGLSPASLDNFLISPDLPRLDPCSADVSALRRIIRDKKAVCVAIDPVYLALNGKAVTDLFAMGKVLRRLAEVCGTTGCTILIVHHCRRSRSLRRNPATLDDVTGNGFAEFAAQWLLLARRRPFDPDTGEHEMWLSAGGRAGHNGVWSLAVNEGRAAENGRSETRCWETAILSASAAQRESEHELIEADEIRRSRRAAIALERNRVRTVEVLEEVGQPVNFRYLRDSLGLNGLRMRHVLASLDNDGFLIKTEHARGKRMEVRYSVPRVEAVSKPNGAGSRRTSEVQNEGVELGPEQRTQKPADPSQLTDDGQPNSNAAADLGQSKSGSGHSRANSTPLKNSADEGE